MIKKKTNVNIIKSVYILLKVDKYINSDIINSVILFEIQNN
jgi:hypothetical protein